MPSPKAAQPDARRWNVLESGAPVLLKQSALAHFSLLNAHLEKRRKALAVKQANTALIAEPIMGRPLAEISLARLLAQLFTEDAVYRRPGYKDRVGPEGLRRFYGQERAIRQELQSHMSDTLNLAPRLGAPVRIDQADLWRVEAGRGSNGHRTRGVYELVRKGEDWRLD